MIDSADHPGLLRLIGAKPVVVSENFASVVVGDFEYEVDTEELQMCCVRWRTSWTNIFSMFAPFGGGAVSSGQHHRSKSETIRFSSPIQRGRR